MMATRCMLTGLQVTSTTPIILWVKWITSIILHLRNTTKLATRKASPTPTSGKPPTRTMPTGWLTSQTDNKGNKTEIKYDSHGRIDYTTSPEGTQNYLYVQSGNGKGQIQRITAPNGTYIEYGYDNLGRVNNQKTGIDGRTFELAYGYNADKVTSISAVGANLAKNMTYDPATGQLTQINLTAPNTTNILWTLNQLDAQTKRVTFGNNVVTTEQRDANGFITSINATAGGASGNSVFNMAYSFDPVTANLEWRSTQRNGQTLKENFTYNTNLDCLTASALLQNDAPVSQSTVNYTNQLAGNIGYKTDVGTYKYKTDKVHAVAEITNPEPPLASLPNQLVTYTSFNKIESITSGAYRQEFTYGPDQQRLKTLLYHNNTLVHTRYYTGYGQIDIDSTGNQTEKLQLTNDEGTTFAELAPNNPSVIRYMHTDYQGTPLAITDQNGALLPSKASMHGVAAATHRTGLLPTCPHHRTTLPAATPATNTWTSLAL